MDAFCFFRLFMALVMTMRANGVCIFPHVMYKSHEHWWRILSRDQNLSIYHRYRGVRFQVTDKFEVDYVSHVGEAPVLTHTYRCQQDVGEETYLLEKESGGGVLQYLCMKFIIRNSHVVQWAKSEEVDLPDITLCNSDNLILQDEPLIYYNGEKFWRNKEFKANYTYKPCPFSGGYIVQWHDPVLSSNICDGPIPPFKMENECERGEGLRFHVPRDQGTCRGPDTKVMNSQYNCLANWDHGEYSYTLIVRPDDMYDHVYCLRLPRDYDDAFSGYLFMDTVCDSTDIVENSRNYRQLTFQKYPVNNICEDETPHCSQFTSNDCDIPEAEMCRKTCEVCHIDEVGEEGAVTDTDIRGIWSKDTTKGGFEKIVVLEKMFVFPHGEYKVVAISDCKREIGGETDGDAKEYIVMSSYTNGCSPRITGITVVKRSPSVYSYRLSKSIVAHMSIDIDVDDFSLHVDNNMWKYDCDKLEYDGDADPIGDRYHVYRGGWHNIVYSLRNAPTVQCNLPLEPGKQHFVLRVPDGGSCTGELVEDAEFVDKFTVHVQGCAQDSQDSDTSVVILGKQSFKYSCLANFQGDNPNRRYIIAEKDISRLRRSREDLDVENLWGKEYLCWMFLVDKGEIMLLPHSDCDANSEHLVHVGTKQTTGTMALTASTTSLTSPTVLLTLVLPLTVSCIAHFHQLYAYTYTHA